MIPKLPKINISLNSGFYIKDPESSDLGMRILSGSIDLLDEIGFDDFNFRKLGQQIGSPEASIYRYFESKHKLLLYLTAWYWGWMEYRLLFRIANVESAEERLCRAIDLLTEQVEVDNTHTHINEPKLYNIVVAESSKVYQTRAVDEENREGLFARYKSLVQIVSDIIIEINPGYKYPHMLVTTVVEGSHHERYFAQHLPKLTDVVSGEDSIAIFFRELVLKSIKS